MKILFLPLLLASAPVYDVAMATVLGGKWAVLRNSTLEPVELSTDPANPICKAELSYVDTLDVAHVIYKARVLPGTQWAHVTSYGDTVMAHSSPDGFEVTVLVADSNPIDLAHAACVLKLTKTSAYEEAAKLEGAILDAGTY
jgi:hypothetical protein